MKGKILKLRHLLTMAILVACLVGCGNQESTTTEPTTEVEEPTVTEKPTETVEPTDEVDSEKVEEKKEEPTTEEVQEEPTTEMVDWETFAAQADNKEGCIVVSNETKGYQEILTVDEEEDFCEYQIQEGDRVAIPIKENWSRIHYVTATSNDPVEIYRYKDFSTIEPKFIEFEIEEGQSYQIVITDVNGNDKIFVLRQ